MVPCCSRIAGFLAGGIQSVPIEPVFRWSHGLRGCPEGQEAHRGPRYIREIAHMLYSLGLVAAAAADWRGIAIRPQHGTTQHADALTHRRR